MDRSGSASSALSVCDLSYELLGLLRNLNRTPLADTPYRNALGQGIDTTIPVSLAGFREW